MSTAQTLLLGAIAGLTIFVGLPLGRLQSSGTALKATLSSVAIGILLFLLYDVLSHGVTPVDKALTGAVKHGGSWGDFVGLAALLAGGFGVGPIEKLYRALLDVEEPLEIVTVTGRNQKAKTQLEKVERPDRHRVKILGFTDQMDELMAAADLVLSKPGGLTTSETLARGAAMVIVNPIPGQETRNSDFLLESGAAIKVNNIATLSHKVTALIRDPERLAQLKANARRVGRPRAAFDVAEQSLKFIA